MNTAHLDQFEAACRDVRTRVDKIKSDPGNDRTVVEAKDMAIHDALSRRLGEELRAGEVRHCCRKMESPRVMYWVPRVRAVMCDDHWRMSRVCSCVRECDACRLPLDEAVFMYLFMGPFIVQAALCLSCQQRTTLSPDRA